MALFHMTAYVSSSTALELLGLIVVLDLDLQLLLSERILKTWSLFHFSP